MSRNKKGMTGAPGLIMFTLIVVVVVSFFYIITMIPFVEKMASIRSEAQFQASQDDRGTALAAFLKSDTTGKTYAEILGSQAAEGVDASLDDGLEATLNKMKDNNNPEGKVAVYDGDALKKNYNGVKEGYIKADLALPGVKKGEVRIA